MRVMILHLSDIHLTNTTDFILDKVEAIVSSVQNLDYELSGCIVALTGDIAYSGSEEQYIIALEFIDSLLKHLHKKLSLVGRSIPVHFVAVPGNHDCYLPSHQSDGARLSIISSLLKDHKMAHDSSIQELCLNPQNNFFEFLIATSKYSEAEKVSAYDKRLSYKYDILIEKEAIAVYCCNTAWLSKRREDQGELFVPADALPDQKANHSLIITLYHHPLNWHEANEAKAFSKRLTSLSDIILTGHEHEPNRHHLEGDRGENFAHIEGGTLQEASDSASSTFNVMIIDTVTKKQKFASLRWDGSIYALDRYRPEAEGGGLTWEDFHVNRLRLSAEFSLLEKMQVFLDEPGVSLQHQAKGVLSLKDIFLPPDLRELNLSSTVSPRIVSGTNLLRLIEENPHLLITGDSQAGKTCLGKMVFQALLETGYVPVWLSPEYRNPPAGDRIFGFLEELFLQQYQNSSLNAFTQLDRIRRVIVVDDYDKIKLTAGAKRRFIERLTNFAGTVILLAHDLAQGLDDILHPSAQVFFSRFKIQPFSHQQRDSLIQQWFSLATNEDHEALDLAQKLNEITKIINTVIGNNFVPAYPIYVLSLLQASEASTPINTGAGTHGYFYEILIKASLLKGRTSREYDIISAYLAHLAYCVFELNNKKFSETEFRQFHTAYLQKHDIRRSYEQMRDQLLNNGIIQRNYTDLYYFKYGYIYYYFVASYFRDHINNASIREHISKLARTLFRSDNANILLFLAHLSRDEFLISELIEVARTHYETIEPAQLKRDVDFVNRLEEIAETIVFEDQGVLASRKELMEKLDRAEEERLYTEEQLDQIDEARAAIDPIAKLNSALKTMQILGQVLKNFPGHLEKDIKLTMARHCYALGLRALASVFSHLENNQEALVSEILNLIREHHPEMREASTRRMAQKTVVSLARLSALGIIKRISASVGSQELTQTYERLASEMKTPSVQLVDVSLNLDHAGQFPESLVEQLAKTLKGNRLAYWLLQCLVVNYFHVFDTSLNVKKRICAVLGVQYKPAKFFDEREKILTLNSGKPG